MLDSLGKFTEGRSKTGRTDRFAEIMRPRQSYKGPSGAPLKCKNTARRCPRHAAGCACSFGGTFHGMRQIAPLEDRRVLSPADMALALKLVGETDLLRLKTIARLHAR